MMRQKPVVLFLLYHGKSHFISCFNLARSIQNTHTVVFAGVEFFNGFVKSQGFAYYPLKTIPFGIGLEKWYNSVTNRKPIYWKTIVDRWTDRLYHLRRKELTQLVLTVSPTHILVDSLQASDFIVLHKLIASRGVQFGLIHNMLPAAYSTTTLPLNSVVLPEGKKQIRQAYRAEQFHEWKQRWKQRLKYFGLSDHDIIQRRIRKNNIPTSFLSDKPSLFYPVLKGIPEFVLMNAEFDFNHTDSTTDRYYLGSQIDILRRDTTDPNYQAVALEIQDQVSKGTPLVYCSMGTLPPLNRQEVISFLTKIISATKDLQCLLIISFQMNDKERSSLMPGNNHVHIFDSVPQLAVLQMASVFVNHGGLNSIKESIEAEVPMLVYPANATYDHSGNTARVVYHKLGIRTEVGDELDKIKNAMKHLLNDRGFKARLKAFKESNAACSIQPFIDFVLPRV